MYTYYCHVSQSIRHSVAYNVTFILLIIVASYSVGKYYQFICGLNSSFFFLNPTHYSV